MELYLKRVLLTGAAGFVGRQLAHQLITSGYQVVGVVRNSDQVLQINDLVTSCLIKTIDPHMMFNDELFGIDTIIHLAARVHVMSEVAKDPLEEFRRVNLRGTETLARHAALAGVKRFVLLSSIGVNGENSGDRPYTELDQPNPHNPYSVSKYEAELALKEIAKQTGIEVVIIRAPLVYGPDNPGNFLSLLGIVSKGIPLPLAKVQNNRSLIYVGNLVDALTVCAAHPAAVGRTYLISDGEDVSTPELIRRIAAALDVSARLFSVPIPLMRLAGKLTGKSSVVNRLTGSLTVDSLKIRQELGWVPPFTVDEGLAETALWYKNRHKSHDQTNR